MLPPNTQKPESVLKVLSAKKALGNETTGNSAIMISESLRTTKTNTSQHEHEVDADYSSPKSQLNHFSKQHSETRFRSLKGSGPGGPALLAVNTTNIPTSNIVNRALEVMNNSLKDSDYSPRQPMKPVDDDDTETPSDSGNSDNDNDVDSPTEPTSRLGNITAQLSFRKIAKKRRKAGGRSSFHHTKSSKEYLRKAQEAYQRLKFNEQEQQNDQCGTNSTQKIKNDCDQTDSANSSETRIKTAETAVDYGYGDPAVTEKQDTVDYGYGDTTESQPQSAIDYGYGDHTDGQPSRRKERPRRRNSVTKYSMEAANVVAAQAAAQRILQLKPSLTSLSRSYSTTPTIRKQPQQQPRGPNSEKNLGSSTVTTTSQASTQTTLAQRNQNPENKDQQSRTSNTMVLEPQQSDYLIPLRTPDDKGSSLKKLTSDYFSSDPKPNNLQRRKSGRSTGTTFRFSAPARTSSWLSHDTYSTANKDDDDDVDSLASDMESLCSVRDNSYRLDTHLSMQTPKKMDMPPVLPTSPSASPLTFSSPPPDRRSRFTGARNISGDMSLRKSLAVSWSSGSNKEGSLSRFAKPRARRDMQNVKGDFPILPCVRVATNGSASKFMPAPVNRSPSINKELQRQD